MFYKLVSNYLINQRITQDLLPESFKLPLVYIVRDRKHKSRQKVSHRNPTQGRHQISQPMRIEAPILFCKKKIYIYPERFLIIRALRVGPQMHQSTSQTPPMCGPSTGAIWNNSLFLRLNELVKMCTSPLVVHLPRMDDLCICLV